MLVNFVFNENENERDFDIIDIPDTLANDIEDIHQKFVDWVYDEANNSKFFMRIDGFKGHSYEMEDFLEWLSDNFANEINGKVKVVSRNVQEIDCNNPTIYF